MAIGGLTHDQNYFVINGNSTTIKLASSVTDALNGIAINLTSVGSGSDHQLIPSVVETASNEIIAPNHGFQTGQAIVYRAGTGSSVSAGLTDGGQYFAIATGRDRLKIAATRLTRSRELP